MLMIELSRSEMPRIERMDFLLSPHYDPSLVAGAEADPVDFHGCVLCGKSFLSFHMNAIVSMDTDGYSTCAEVRFGVEQIE